MSPTYPPEKTSPTASSSRFDSSQSLPTRDDSGERRSGINPKTWTWKIWLIVGAVLAAIIVGATVGGVLGSRANAYPNYYRIEYQLKDTYAGDGFFDNFDYFTGYDPTHGFVHYVDEQGSMAQNLTQVTSSPISTSSSSASLVSNSSQTYVLRVDTTDKNATTGRRSVRLTSTRTYSSGLFIFDILHSPFGCATWPALWLSDPNNWPTNGEIDVMESVNVGDTGNQMTLHTTSGCQIGKNRKRKQTGKAISYSCVNTTNGNEGCGVQGPDNTFGQAFNDIGGGVYTMELRSEGIRIWMFARDAIPQDIKDQSPDPSSWGTALADFPNLECDIGSHFKNMSIIANIDLCGDWAGQASIFNANSQCTGTCSDWVADQAESFEDAYWEFGGMWVYEGK